MKVKEIMIKKFPKVHPDDTIDKAIKIIIEVPESALPVVDSKNKVVGEISQRDLLMLDIGKEEFHDSVFSFAEIQKLLDEGAKTVKQLMNDHEILLREDDDVITAAKLLYDEELSTIPVVDKKGKLKGIITEITILKHYKEIAKL